MKNYHEEKNNNDKGITLLHPEFTVNIKKTIKNLQNSQHSSICKSSNKLLNDNDLLDENEPMEDTLIQFDSEDDQEDITPLTPWKILIADDDANVHDTTVLALSGVLVHGRPLEFFHAYSAQATHTLVSNHPDAAILLLDVVMESADAGLKLVPILRNELGRLNLRIIMRTGQPGYAKDRIMEDFHIDGYTSKAQLTRTILIKIINDVLITNSEMNNGIH
jgi:CheY-like chemotaxis protein